MYNIYIHMSYMHIYMKYYLEELDRLGGLEVENAATHCNTLQHAATHCGTWKSSTDSEDLR